MGLDNWSVNFDRKIRLVSFSDGSLGYRLARARFLKEATASGLFESIQVYSKKSLVSTMRTQQQSTLDLLNRKNKGFGFWLWKPLLISHELENLSSEIDLLLYLDVGCTLNINSASLKRLKEYIEIAERESVLTFHLPGYAEDQWTKTEAITRAGLAEHELKTPQRLGGVLLFSNSARARKLASEWSEFSAADNSAYLKDATPELTGGLLRAHRHDQSLWSLVSKSNGVQSLADETYFAPTWLEDGYRYPFWATRKLTSKIPPAQPSLLDKIKTRALKSLP